MKFLAVTRPKGQGEDTAKFIRHLGCMSLIIHTVEYRPRGLKELSSEIRAVLSEGAPDWLIFMSPFGVQLWFDALRPHSSPLPGRFGHPRIVAVGPRTQEALLNQGFRDTSIPEDYSSEGVAAFLSKLPLDGKRVVLARSSDAGDSLARMLGSKGANVTTTYLYSASIPDDRSTVKTLVEELRKGTVCGVLFTSSKSTSNLFEIAEKKNTTPDELAHLLRTSLVGAIGPATAKKLRELGIQPDIMPTRYLINEAVRLLAETVRAGEALPTARPA